jgi:hypothetical protein
MKITFDVADNIPKEKLVFSDFTVFLFFFFKYIKSTLRIIETKTSQENLVS